MEDHASSSIILPSIIGSLIERATGATFSDNKKLNAIIVNMIELKINFIGLHPIRVLIFKMHQINSYI